MVLLYSYYYLRDFFSHGKLTSKVPEVVRFCERARRKCKILDTEKFEAAAEDKQKAHAVTEGPLLMKRKTNRSAAK